MQSQVTSINANQEVRDAFFAHEALIAETLGDVSAVTARPVQLWHSTDMSSARSIIVDNQLSQDRLTTIESPVLPQATAKRVLHKNIDTDALFGRFSGMLAQ